MFIANDWHTALLPVYLKAYYRDNGMMKYTRSVLVIHNIAHQVSLISNYSSFLIHLCILIQWFNSIAGFMFQWRLVLNKDFYDC